MRSILLAAVLATATLVTDVHTADACGGSYERQPIAHTIATPRVEPELRQSFVLLHGRLEAKRAATMTWTQIGRRTFDTTKTAPGRRLDAPHRLTLLGPSGTKTVEIRDTVWLDLAFDQEQAREAMALPKGDFVVALAGHSKDATWQSFEVIHGSTATSFRSKDLHITQPHGTTSFFVGSAFIGGHPIGVVTVKGARYVAVRSSVSHDTSLVKI